MDENAGLKEYAVSAVLIFAALAALFFLKLFFFREPDGPFFAVYVRGLLYGLIIGWVASFVCLIARKPALLVIIAAAVIFTSFFCYADRFTSVFAAGAVCALGSIPFAASLLAKIGQKK